MQAILALYGPLCQAPATSYVHKGTVGAYIHGVDLRLFSQNALWAALKEAGYTERRFRTVRRWVEQGEEPTPEAERIILKLIGATKEAAPDVPERLEKIEGLLRLIAPKVGVKIAQVEEMERRVSELTKSQPHNAAGHHSVRPPSRGRPRDTGR